MQYFLAYSNVKSGENTNCIYHLQRNLSQLGKVKCTH